ncbi:hypothetical protein CYMTET_25530 [Cymbomonas tetramitiformis]|uniref:Uncharacterized protein n=1 Tax=Cymbomonas tetramitiformis TaxID=36881 RepID=A0AAE0KYV4_9CHLO|nr:hypothetical protein CYMTET_25530 [Cymbomonas tetramitiformis]
MAGVKPEIVEDFSASSFGTVDDAPDDIEEFMQNCQRVDTHMGVCTVGAGKCGALYAHEPDLSFADKLAAMCGFTVDVEEDAAPLALCHMRAATEDDEREL